MQACVRTAATLAGACLALTMSVDTAQAHTATAGQPPHQRGPSADGTTRCASPNGTHARFAAHRHLPDPPRHRRPAMRAVRNQAPATAPRQNDAIDAAPVRTAFVDAAISRPLDIQPPPVRRGGRTTTR